MSNATEEAEKLVDGVVKNARTQLVEKYEDTIQNLVNQLSDKPYRDMNVIFSETRNRLEEVKNE